MSASLNLKQVRRRQRPPRLSRYKQMQEEMMKMRYPDANGEAVA